MYGYGEDKILDTSQGYTHSLEVPSSVMVRVSYGSRMSLSGMILNTGFFNLGSG